ncbi:hypothetical protein ACFX16_007753 [Malus domestica]
MNRLRHRNQTRISNSLPTPNPDPKRATPLNKLGETPPLVSEHDQCFREGENETYKNFRQRTDFRTPSSSTVSAQLRLGSP